MKKIQVFIFSLLLICSCSSDAQEKAEITIPKPTGKAIYVPKDLQSMDLQNADSQWSYHRMATSENFVIFWEKGFGSDLSKPPQLSGHDMKVNLQNLINKLEHFYKIYRDDMKFIKPGSISEKYRMMVMLNYSLEGTAYGGNYDDIIGALWVAPNRIQDTTLNCIAHELGHCFQSQITCDGEGAAWGGCGFFEMTSQWMLWQVNPNWIHDEEYHWTAFCGLTHKAFLHLENIYHSPYILEYWSEKHGTPVIADLFRAGKQGEDPVMTYKTMFNLSQEQFCDEMFTANCHILNLDFEHATKETRPYAAPEFKTIFETASADGWKTISAQNCPENYGFNAIPMDIPQAGKSVTIHFEGNTNLSGYHIKHVGNAGWRYGFVAVTTDGKTIYAPMGKEKSASVTYTTPADAQLSHLWFVVMGAPTEHWMNEENGTDAQWPYRIKIENK